MTILSPFLVSLTLVGLLLDLLLGQPTQPLVYMETALRFRAIIRFATSDYTTTAGRAETIDLAISPFESWSGGYGLAR